MQLLAPSPSQRGTPFHGLTSLSDMLRFHAHKFVGVLNTLARLDLAADKDWTFQPDTRRYLGDQISQIATQLEEMRLPVSLKKAREIEFIFKGAVIMEGQRESIFGILKDGFSRIARAHRSRDRIEASFLHVGCLC